MAYSNAAVNVVLPKPRRRGHNYLSLDEVLELLDAVDPRDRVLVAVLCFAGLRFGEAAALRVRNLWLDRARVRVEEAIAEDGGKVVVGPPKDNEIRTVAVPAFLVAALREHVRDLPRDALVFPAPRGGHLHLTTWRRRRFYAAIDRINGHGSSGSDQTTSSRP